MDTLQAKSNKVAEESQRMCCDDPVGLQTVSSG
jgi:hypothetical protein